MEFIRFIFSDPFIFMGFFLILFIILAFIYDVSVKFFASRNIKNQGWPPSHCDAHGNLKDEDYGKI